MNIEKNRKIFAATKNGYRGIMNFKAKRIEAGFPTQQSLADYWGVGRETIGRLENGSASILHFDALEYAISKRTKY